MHDLLEHGGGLMKVADVEHVVPVELLQLADGLHEVVARLALVVLPIRLDLGAQVLGARVEERERGLALLDGFLVQAKALGLLLVLHLRLLVLLDRRLHRGLVLLDVVERLLVSVHGHQLAALLADPLDDGQDARVVDLHAERQLGQPPRDHEGKDSVVLLLALVEQVAELVRGDRVDRLRDPLDELAVVPEADLHLVLDNVLIGRIELDRSPHDELAVPRVVLELADELDAVLVGEDGAPFPSVVDKGTFVARTVVVGKGADALHLIVLKLAAIHVHIGRRVHPHPLADTRLRRAHVG
mmetsp:Transcript_26104/g.69474  ORF Transcript_26104/g.69474 Transcript_26104/m.69474 type:complete len:299 (+) Transcript_26104:2929-3825(+)